MNARVVSPVTIAARVHDACARTIATGLPDRETRASLGRLLVHWRRAVARLDDRQLAAALAALDDPLPPAPRRFHPGDS